MQRIVPWLALLVTLVCSGCAPVRQEVDYATKTSDGRIWLTGTYGFGTVVSPRGTARMDYPASGDLYGNFYFPTANVVELDGKPWMITRTGQLLRPSLEESRWEPVEPALYLGDEWNRQVDYATATKDGLLFMHVHSDRLVWAKPGESRPRAEEKLSGYMEHVTLIATPAGEEVYALGWRGNIRVVMRRLGPQNWREMGVIPAWGQDLRGFVMLDGRLIAPTYYGVFVARQEGGFDFVSTDDLLPDEKTAPQKLVTAADPGPTVAVAVPEPRAATVESAPQTKSFIAKSFDLGGGRWAFSIGGARPGFLVMGSREAGAARDAAGDGERSYLPCATENVATTVGAVAERGGLLAVQPNGALIGVWLDGNEGCSVRSAALLGSP